MRSGRVIELFEKTGLHVKSLRYFRVASSKIGKLADTKGFEILKLEEALCKIPLVRNVFSVHYNIVFFKP